MIKIDRGKCTDCLSCFEVCPNYVLTFDKFSGKDKVAISRPELCNKCGHCVAVCHKDAIIHNYFKDSELELVPELDISVSQLQNLISLRRSIRKYKNQPISKGQVEQLISGATSAGSAANLQSEEFIVINDRKLLEKLELIVIDELWNMGIKYINKKSFMSKLVSLKYTPSLIDQFYKYHQIIKLRRKNQQQKGMIFRNAPCLIIIHGIKNNSLAGLNAGIAARNIEFMAQVKGIGSCHTGLFVAAASKQNRAIHSCLGIDNSRQIQAGLMVGFPKYKYKKKLTRNKRNIVWL